MSALHPPSPQFLRDENDYGCSRPADPAIFERTSGPSKRLSCRTIQLAKLPEMHNPSHFHDVVRGEVWPCQIFAFDRGRDAIGHFTQIDSIPRVLRLADEADDSRTADFSLAIAAICAARGSGPGPVSNS